MYRGNSCPKPQKWRSIRLHLTKGSQLKREGIPRPRQEDRQYFQGGVTRQAALYLKRRYQKVSGKEQQNSGVRKKQKRYGRFSP